MIAGSLPAAFHGRMKPAVHYEGTGRTGLRYVREHTSDALADVTIPIDADDFFVKNSVNLLSSAVLLHSTMTSVRVDRTARHVAHGGLDHYQLHLYRAGSYRVQCGSSTAAVQPGDVGIFDMTERARFDVRGQGPYARADQITLHLPRTLVSSLLAKPESGAITVVSYRTPFGRLLANHLRSLSRQAPLLSPAESEAAVRATAALVAGALGCSPDAAAPVMRAHRSAKLAAIRRYIRHHLDAPDLTPLNLAISFGLSRASLYRLFEADGGLAHFVQKCRLERAFAALITPSQRHRALLDIALECGFENEGSFIRAFRRTFDMTPGEVRKQSRAAGWAATAGPTDPRERTVLEWLRRLNGAS